MKDKPLIWSFLVLAAIGLSLNVELWAHGHKRAGVAPPPQPIVPAPLPQRYLLVRFQVHLQKCSSCAQKMANLIQKIEGVEKVQAHPENDAADVFYKPGLLDIQDVKDALTRAGFQAQIAWGPAAVTLEGKPEPIPDNEMPKKRPVLKEIWTADEREERHIEALVERSRAQKGEPSGALKVLVPTVLPTPTP